MGNGEWKIENGELIVDTQQKLRKQRKKRKLRKLRKLRACINTD